MVQLPEAFLERMREMLDEEFKDFLASYERNRVSGIRVNERKCSPERFEELAPWDLEKIPWVKNGFFCDGSVRPAQHPFYAAGVFYLQEPSAMTPASRLPVTPGERVLDLCAAPGGKATHLAAALKGEGLLVANDISNSRARALLHNLELFGAGNIFVTNETPGKLSEAFPEFFDKVLVDAPCSGEGMFRKDEAVIRTWTPDRPEFFANQQRDIVENAVKMLKPGGLLLYSTCTFAPVEDEGTVSYILEHFPEMHLTDMEGYEGFAPGRPGWGNGNPELARCIRIWPHKMNGEGHFLALFQKDDICEGEDMLRKDHVRNKEEQRKDGRKKDGGKGTKCSLSGEDWLVVQEFLADVHADIARDGLEIRGGKVYAVPQLPERVRGLHFLRNGLLLGEIKKGRFEPSQPFAMALGAELFSDCLNLPADDERVLRYLKGETIPVGERETKSEKGWKLVCVEGFSLGWGKLVNGILKNKYPAGWRRS